MINGRKIFKFVLLKILLLLILQNSFAQFYFLDDLEAKIDIEFAKSKIEIKAKSSVFNILTIVNSSENPQSVIVNLSVPEGWNLIGDEIVRLKLNPYDTIKMPVRVALAKDVKGEIGYAVVATVTDDEGNVITSQQSYINIPRESDLQIKNLTRSAYFDQQTGLSAFKIKVDNRGNTDETIYFEIESDEDIEIPGESRNLYVDDIVLQPYSDTIISYQVLLSENYNQFKTSFGLDFRANYQDTSYASTVFFKKIDNEYSYLIPENKKPLIVEISAQNLLSNFKTNYSILTTGTVLFKNSRNINYYYRNYRSNTTDDFITYSRMWINLNASKLAITLGDAFYSFGQSLIGRGLYMSYKLKKHKISGLINKTPTSENYNYGGEYSYRINNNLSIESEYGYRKNDAQKLYSSAYAFASRISFLNKQNIFLQYGQSKEDRNNTIRNGRGFRVDYFGSINKFRMRLRTRYGDRFYTGFNKGRFDIDGMISYAIAKNNYINLNYASFRYRPAVFINNILMPLIFTNYEVLRLDYAFNLSPQIKLNVTPLFENNSSNSFSGFQNDAIFQTHYYGLKTGLRVRIGEYMTFSPAIKTGFNKIQKYSNLLFDQEIRSLKTNGFTTSIVSFNFTARYFGTYLSYYYGPSSLSQQFSYFYGGNFNQAIRVMPYVDVFLFKDILKVSLRTNYVNSIDTRANRANVSAEVGFFPGKSWDIRFVSTFSYSSTYDSILEERYKYSNSYFELRVRKEFGFAQPRIKFNDLTIIFYKDLNGNRSKETNEPGIRNVFVTIKRDELYDVDNDNYEYEGDFLNMDLLSDQKGVIKYENVAEGKYTAEFYPMDNENGTYTSEATYIEFLMNKDKTIYVPFMENNKIFGKVVMNRSKLSNLGPIDISNLKITATDREGKVTSTLTDKSGNFVLYVPSVDKYIVKINNIFYENFDLQQNNFEVQLNGYKQFELSFIFNEKRRRIRFASDYETDQQMETMGIEIVKRTNLKGFVKDATTQKSIVSNVRVLDENGNVVVKTKSDIVDGRYNVSFLAGENYRIEVSADDYWFYSEKLYERQITTFQNIQKDILMKKITVGSIIPLNKLLFEEGKADLQSEASAELDRLLEVLRNNPTVRIFVNGHADDLEVLDVGPEIATERAKMVARYLIANGYSRIEYVGHGNSKPVAPNDTPENRARNRRVEVVVKSK